MTFELAGKQYDAPEFVMNLVKHSKATAVKNFKNAYEQRQRALGDTTSITNQKFSDKAIELLESQFDHDKLKVTLVMSYIIKFNPNNILSEFIKRYERDYAKHIKKI